MTSPYWNHFIKPSSSSTTPTAECNYCNKLIKVNGEIHQALKKHLTSLHKEVLISIENGTNNSISSYDTLPEERLISRMTTEDNMSYNTIAKSKALRNVYQKSGYNIPRTHKSISKKIKFYYGHIKEKIINEIKIKLGNLIKFISLVTNGLQ